MSREVPLRVFESPGLKIAVAAFRYETTAGAESAWKVASRDWMGDGSNCLVIRFGDTDRPEDIGKRVALVGPVGSVNFLVTEHDWGGEAEVPEEELAEQLLARWANQARGVLDGRIPAGFESRWGEDGGRSFDENGDAQPLPPILAKLVKDALG